MKTNDVYQSLLDMYDGSPFKTSKVAESLAEVLHLQFTPEEAELAVKVGLREGSLMRFRRELALKRTS